jgi:tetratricopeptide (TPR) repeat protein
LSTRSQPCKRALFAVLALLALAAGCRSAPQPVTKIVGNRVVVTRSVSPHAYEHVTRALLLEREDRLEEAASELQRALSYDQDAPEVHARLGEIFIRLDRLDDAAEQIQRSLAIESTVDGLVARAHLQTRRGRPADAVKTLGEAAELVSFDTEPDQAESVFLERAEAQLAAMDVAGARATLESLLGHLTTSENGLFRLAALEWALGNMKPADLYLGRIIEIDPDNLDTLLVRAWLHVALDDRAKARALFKQALDRSERSVDVAVLYARWLVATNHLQEARALADDLAAGEIDDSDLMDLMELERTVKRPERALELAQNLGKGDPPPAVVGRAQLAQGAILAAMDRDRDALAAFNEVPAEAPEYHDARLRAVALLRESGNTTLALKLLDEIESKGVDDAVAIAMGISRAQVQERAGDAARALRTLDLLSRDHPDSVQIALTRAAIEERRGNWKQALVIVESILARHPSNPEALNFWGYTAADHSHRLPEALARTQAALVFEPATAAVLDSAGWALFRSGRTQEAQAFLDQAINLEPEDPELLGHLAEVLEARGHKQMALATLKKALGLDPEERVRKSLEQKLRQLEAREAAGR